MIEVILVHVAAGIRQRDALQGFAHFQQLVVLSRWYLAYEHLAAWPELEQALLVQGA